MKLPPIRWEDLVAFGMSPNAVVCADARIAPKPHWLAARVFAAAFACPPLDDDSLAYMRDVRDLAMAATDWTQAADSPLTETQRAAWAAYRQALRDLPANYSGEGPIPWPVAP